MFEALNTWWQNVTPQMQANLKYGGIAFAALVGGHFIGAMVARALRNRNFDAALRLPRAKAYDPEAEHGFTPTLVAGLLVRLTIWAAAGWWLAQQYGHAEFAATLGLIIKRTWALAAVLVAALAVANVLAHSFITCLQSQTSSGTESLDSRLGSSGSRGNLAGVVGAVAYGLVVLLALLIVADMFEWPLTRSAALVLWGFAEHLLIAGCALLMGCFGARVAYNLATADASSSPEKRASQYTALGIMGATTLLAVILLLSSAGLLLALATLAVVGFLLWLVRGYLPDVLAGMQLRAHQVREAWFDGVAYQVAAVGFITTRLCQKGQFYQVQNRIVLDSRMQSSTPATPRRRAQAEPQTPATPTDQHPHHAPTGPHMQHPHMDPHRYGDRSRGGLSEAEAGNVR